MPRFVAIEDALTAGRGVVCRVNQHGWATAVSSHIDMASAEREAARLQAEFDKRFASAASPPRPHQMVLGFYGPEQGDA